MKSAGNSEESGSRRNHESFWTCRNQYNMVTRVQANSQRPNSLQTATTMENFTDYDEERPENDDDERDIKQLMNAIKNVPTMIQRNTQRYDLLHTQVHTFKGQKNCYIELEHFF